MPSYTNRVVGAYDENRPGPLVILLAGVHGNEPAGVKALEELFHMLDDEKARNTGFAFRGRVVGMLGNLKALALGERFIAHDLNRQWTPERIETLCATDPMFWEEEDREQMALLEAIQTAIAEAQPEELYILDLHTTSAEGGIFAIPGDSAASLAFAKALHAPVILGLMSGLNGTLLHFAEGNHFARDGYPKRAVSAAFEGGRHDDPLSVSRCIAACLYGLRAAACIEPKDVNSRHEHILKAYAQRLPAVSRISYVYHLKPGDAFRMRPGYVNFQPVKKGEHLADDARGPVLSQEEGRILMPLYQPKGADGFTIIKEEAVS